LGYLENGTHIGVGAQDTGEYREWKDKCHQEALKPFQERCYALSAKREPLYVGFGEKVDSIKLR
jgi:hypothetical protein